jgi:hypothetical protein
VAMAQQKHFVSRWFDLYWRQPREELAAKVLLDIEESWLQSDRTFPFRQGAAILLHIFAFPFECYMVDIPDRNGVRWEYLWRRTLEEWYGIVDSPESECAKLSPKRDELEYYQLVESLCLILARAVKSWEKHGPNMPPCGEVIRDICNSLIERRFVIQKHG